LLDRILYEDDKGREAAIINIQENKALPTWRDGTEIVEGIESGKIRVLIEDPFAFLCKPEEAIPEAMRKHRDHAWKVIQSLLKDHYLDLLNRSFRGELIARSAKETGISEVTILLYLRKYWQRGQTPNALLPDFFLCGGKGKRKKLGEKKVGRRRIYVANPEQQQGINIGEKKKLLLAGLRKYHGRKEGQFRSFVKAHKKTLEEYFNIGYAWHDGKFVPIMPPIETLPTKAQAWYWYKESVGIEKRTIQLEGEREFNLRHRQLHGNAQSIGVFGPGSLFQIDSTIGDIYLVSSFDRTTLVGRPTIYMVRDIFSRLIVGFNITLEHAGWIGGMCALENALTDKVEYCQRYGIKVRKEEWPANHLPSSLLADRAEFMGHIADYLPKSLGIAISNTAPYEAEWKPIIERTLREMNDDQLHRLPGAVKRKPQRGDPDYRLAAILDIDQLRKLMILWIRKLNNATVYDKYPLSKKMMADHVPPIPIELWNWGIKNQIGILREKPPDIVRINLLPREEARITERGIEFRSLHFDCDQGRKEGWFIDARMHGRRKITVSYDPRCVNQIFYFRNNGQEYETCDLMEMDSMFLNHDWEEVRNQRVANRLLVASVRSRELQHDAEYETESQAIVQQAREQNLTATKEMSKSAKIKNMRANRHEDRQRERRTQAWTVGEKVGTVPPAPQQIEIPNELPEEEYVGPPSFTDQLERQLNERAN
jgi:hypothetical protein